MILVTSLLQCVASFCLLRLKGNPADRQKALWLHRSCKIVLRRLAFGIRVFGEPPKQGLLVSNHLSYLDILFYGATLPCVFVSKSEVRSWPILGLLAALGGTVFIDRGSARGAVAANTRIESLLAAGITILIFPEGTSSDGSSVLRFYPSLFEPAVRAGASVTAAAIQYSGWPDAAEKDLCYYGDTRFAAHLLRSLRLVAIHATVHFAGPIARYQDRKQAAASARDEVVILRAQVIHEENARRPDRLNNGFSRSLFQ